MQMVLSVTVSLLMMTVLAMAMTTGQISLVDVETASKCQGMEEECVRITKCGPLLGLLPMVGILVCAYFFSRSTLLRSEDLL